MTRRWIRAGLVAYGILMMLLAVRVMRADVPENLILMTTRANGVSASIDVLERGGPPLMGSSVPFAQPGVDRSASYYPVGTTDDQGLYLYLPLVGERFGVREPANILRAAFIALMALIPLVYPLVFYEIFGSLLVALAAPLIAIYNFDYLRDTDIYWISGWSVLFCVPLLLAVLSRRWSRWSVALLALACVIGSFAGSVRINSGLPILIGALIVLVIKERRWRWRAATAALLVAASLSVSTVGLGIVRWHRDRTAGVDLSAGQPTKHPFWHNIYIGLGYLPNPYGIAWDDGLAVEAVKRDVPSAGYLSDPYEGALRRRVVEIAREDTGRVVGLMWAKFGVTLKAASNQFTAVLFLLPIALLIGTARRRFWTWMLVVLPAVLLALIPLLITIPGLLYYPGWLATIGLIEMLAAGAVWCAAVEWLRSQPQVRSRLPEALRPSAEVQPRTRVESRLRMPTGFMPSPRPAVAVGVLVVSSVAIGIPALSRGTAAATESAVHAASPLSSTSLKAFATQPVVNEGVVGAKQWRPQNGATASAAGSVLSVKPSAAAGTVQVESREITLDPGSYRFVLDGDFSATALLEVRPSVSTEAAFALSQMQPQKGLEVRATVRATKRLSGAQDAAPTRAYFRLALVLPGGVTSAPSWTVRSLRIYRGTIPARPGEDVS